MILDNSVLADGENPPYDGSSDGIESNSSDSMVMKA